MIDIDSIISPRHPHAGSGHPCGVWGDFTEYTAWQAYGWIADSSDGGVALLTRGKCWINSRHHTNPSLPGKGPP
ncbi:uncharacterized protein GLRG_01212 [Colletotrichum graminicola M1.001]|uniref:Uncharacterized protein n=1 Tax=Colletotrichum graminicola (strain M1.001 / M2 / FGSC 10212) TaxID=645133 RepID=E3Q4Q3_COLGM|nr:uncharacterized protein GLRG_01212 [Colletotrichum graminicola M1.001]EFQ26068.1 hypothetical protein GLRG_01212 [Colletotrichum graminicola M1.001]